MFSASITAPPEKETGGASLAEHLFLQSVGYMTTIIPSAGSTIKCQHCRREVLSVVGECLVITQRHDSQYHKTVIPLSDLGLMTRTD